MAEERGMVPLLAKRKRGVSSSFILAALVCVRCGAAPGRREAGWCARLGRKQRCVASGAGGYYLYHARKAAGTTLRTALQEAARRHRVAYWETEGLSIDPMFLGLRSIITVMSVRDPVRRVLSMYWYEHVGWHDGIVHDPAGLRTLREWVDEWKDDSAWKRDFARRNPGNVYVEVQNYYTKALAGWNAAGAAAAVDAAALSRARAALERFDAIFVVERATWPNHTALLRRALGHDAPLLATLRGAGPCAIPIFFGASGARDRGVGFRRHDRAARAGDDAARRRLAPRLAPDAAAVVADLEALNGFDRDLYVFALELDDARTAYAPREPRRDGGATPCENPPSRQLGSKTGIFRPPGHKHR